MRISDWSSDVCSSDLTRRGQYYLHNFLRSQPEVVAAKLARRGFHYDLARFTELEARRKRLQGETEQLQAERNSGSKRSGQAKAKGEDALPILADMDRIQTPLADKIGSAPSWERG